MFVTPAYASTAAGAASPMGGILGMAPLLLIFVAFYFLMIRPQQKRVKELQNAVAAVKKGDSVVTGGGLLGKVTKVDEQYVEIEIATGVKVRAVKGTIAEVMPLGGAKPAND